MPDEVDIEAVGPDPFTRILPFDKYDGMTRLAFGDGRMVVSIGTGPEVEAALREAAWERGYPV